MPLSSAAKLDSVRLFDRIMTAESTHAPSYSFSGFLNHAAKYGGIAGVAGGLWMIVDYALGFQTDKVHIGKWTSIIAMVVPIAAVILGMMHWRNKALGGRIRFVQAFGMALAIGLIFSGCMAGAAWLQASKFAPDLLERKIEQQAVIAAQRPDANPEEITKQVELARQSATPVTYAKVVFSMMLMQSLFVGLIASITVPKQQPGTE